MDTFRRGTALHRIARLARASWRPACGVVLGVGVGFLWQSPLWGALTLAASLWCSLALAHGMAKLPSPLSTRMGRTARMLGFVAALTPTALALALGQPVLTLLSFGAFAFRVDELLALAPGRVLAILAFVGGLALAGQALDYLHAPGSLFNALSAMAAGTALGWQSMRDSKPKGRKQSLYITAFALATVGSGLLAFAIGGPLQLVASLGYGLLLAGPVCLALAASSGMGWGPKPTSAPVRANLASIAASARETPGEEALGTRVELDASTAEASSSKGPPRL